MNFDALQRVKALAVPSASKAPNVKQDLLLRLFESEWFTPLMALQYLYQNPQPGVEDYLCSKIHQMSDAQVELYLLQLVYLAVAKPGSTLERTIVGLCAKSFVLALKVRD